MRAIFGLVSLLVVIAIIINLFHATHAPVMQTGAKAQNQARQISGRGQNGVPTMQTFKTEPKFHGRTLEGLMVTDVTPGGAMADYGLRNGDEIVSVNGITITAFGNDNPGLAESL